MKRITSVIVKEVKGAFQVWLNVFSRRRALLRYGLLSRDLLRARLSEWLLD